MPPRSCRPRFLNRTVLRTRDATPKLLSLETLELRQLLAGHDFVISELMASNDRTLDDGDGRSSDWIEIHNVGDAPGSLQGFYLTDDADDKDKWQFPDVTVEPNSHLVVFASGQESGSYVDPAGNLHTNFRLSSAGEYLALVDDQQNVVDQFSPTFGQQFEDISYGRGRQQTLFVSDGDPLTYLVPTDNSLALNWTNVAFDDSSWNGSEQPATSGLGFRTNDATFTRRESFETESASGLEDYPDLTFVTDGTGRVDVEDGVLHLDQRGRDNENMRVTTGVAHDGAFVVQGLVGRAGTNRVDENNVGISIGNVTAVFHPGLDGGAFRFGTITNGSVTDNVDMGFTPTTDALHEMQVTVQPDAAGWQLTVNITAADNSENQFNSSVHVTPAQIGGPSITQVGFVRNGARGGDGIYDDLLVTDDATASGIDSHLIQTDVLGEMHDVNASIYVRQSFEVVPSVLSSATTLTLGARYDDGFVAYLNGHEVARRNAPGVPDSRLPFDASAAEANLDENANLSEWIDISSHIQRLNEGENVLAIQALNLDATDNDFLFSTSLIASTDPLQLYFPEPTPGETNATGFANVVRDTVSFSNEGGTFTDPFHLTLTPRNPNANVFYTNDGSEPTEQSMRYTEPISISGTTQIRARVIEPAAAPGPISTEGYVHLSADVSNFSSQLPILVIDNFGAGAIPNKGWNQTGAGLQLLPRQAANMMIFEPVDGLSRVNTSTDLDSRIGIRVRGAFSSSWPQPGYSVESWGPGIDDDVDIAPLGIAPESDWILYAPNRETDRSLLQNTFLFDLSKQMDHWAIDYQYVEAFVNTDGGDLTMDDFVGLYVLEEKVKRGPDRLDFEPFAADGSSGGWLLNINRLDAISLEGELPKNFHTAGPDGILETERDLADGASRGDDIPRQSNGYLNFDNPNGYEINDVQRQAIEGWFQQMEDVLYDRTEVPWNDPVDGYAKYIDVKSFIDYFILHNLSKNGDGLLISFWLYNPDPNNGGKLTIGPIWDVDVGSFNEDPSANLMHRADRIWYGRLFEDPHFMQAYVDRWQELRDGPISDDNIAAIIANRFEEIGLDAAVRDGVTNWPERVNAMQTWLTARAKAFDESFVQRPEFSQQGGTVVSGFTLEVGIPVGEIFYTTDGTDPRLPGGNPSPTAQQAEFSFASDPVELVGTGAPASAVVPDASIDALIGDSWKSNGFVEGLAGESWTTGTTGIGFDDRGVYAPLIALDLGNDAASAYVRIEFEMANEVPAFDQLILNMQYDDGFVAYLNGREVARSLIPGNVGEPVPFDANADGSHSGNSAEAFDISTEIDALQSGTNLLAIHGANRGRSSDLLILPELVGSFFKVATIVITDDSQVTARTRFKEDWSGPAVATFAIGSQTGDLNNDGSINAFDVDLLCQAIHDNDSIGDLNNDGATRQSDLDFLLQEILGTNLGDANLDGVFDSADLVLVFQAGEYDDDVAGNSTWAEGDWNCDGEFNSSDLVAAFQANR